MKKETKPLSDPETAAQNSDTIQKQNENRPDLMQKKTEIHKLLKELNMVKNELEKQNDELRKVEVALRESEAMYRSVIENAPNQIMIVNKEGGIEFSNSYLPEYKFENVIGKNFIDLAPREYQEKMGEALELAFSEATNQSYQSRGLGENGEMRWYQSNISPLKVSGSVKSAIVLVTDITVLVYEAERQQSIINAAMDGFALLNNDGYLLEVNDAYCQICGYSKEELLHMQISDLMFSENETEIRVEMQKIIEQGEDRFEAKQLRKDGTIVDLEFSVQYYPVDGGQFVAFMHDITERKLIEKELKDNEQKFRDYIDFAPHGIFVANPQGEYIDVNSAVAKITGYSKEELLSMKLHELIPEESQKFATDHFARLATEGYAEDEFSFTRKDQSKGHWSVDAVRLSDQSYIGFVVDLTEHKKVEEALLQSEDLLKTVLDLLPVGVWIFNEKGDIISANNAGQAIWAGAPYVGIEDFGVYKGWWLNSGKLIEPHEWSASRAIEKGETSMNEEIEIECFDGTHKIILNSAVPIFNSDNSIRGAIVTNKDITFRKHAEQALIEISKKLEARVIERTTELSKINTELQLAKEKYRTVADHTYGWEYWTDNNGNFIYCSPSCERITGHPASEFLKNPRLIFDIIHPADLKFFKCHKQNEDKARGSNQEINFRIIKSDGSIRWMGHVCQPIFDVSGKHTGNRGSNRDVTERIHTQQLLKTSNQKYKLLSENITDGIFICRDGLFEYANKAMEQTFGYENNELIGRRLTELVASDYLDELEIFHPLKVSSDLILNVELECIRKDLSQISVEFFFNYLGNERVIYGVAHDISEKKQIQKNILKAIIQTEEKERAYFSKELHDGLGPLLSAIKLYLQWSLRTNTNIPRDEIIQKAEDIIEEALTTVREISNKLSPHLLTNHGLSSAIQSFINKLRESSGITITFESDVKRRLGDEIEAALYRAVIECLNNTVKYAGAKNVNILLNDADSQLLLHYKDDGIGFNLTETLAMKKGLGLFNLQNRIHTIGGKITLYSAPGMGVDYQIIVNL
jgi:PAS domain S-box-containing protein